jgi:hypothetical protein
MKRAIGLTEGRMKREYRFDEVERIKKDLAVMYYHQSLIHAARGNNVEAENDHRKAEEYGYNPAEGVL